jgi:hypothetical protein
VVLAIGGVVGAGRLCDQIAFEGLALIVHCGVIGVDVGVFGAEFLSRTVCATQLRFVGFVGAVLIGVRAGTMATNGVFMRATGLLCVVCAFAGGTVSKATAVEASGDEDVVFNSTYLPFEAYVSELAEH